MKTANATEMTTSEWELMRIIWTKRKSSSSEVIKLIQEKKEWAESTVKTLLRRLVSKGALSTVRDGRRFIYSPNISENDAMDQMTAEMFARLCDMKKGKEIAKLITETFLSRGDIRKIQGILDKKYETAPKEVACNCLPDTNECTKENCCQ